MFKAIGMEIENTCDESSSHIVFGPREVTMLEESSSSFIDVMDSKVYIASTSSNPAHHFPLRVEPNGEGLVYWIDSAGKHHWDGARFATQGEAAIYVLSFMVTPYVRASDSETAPQPSNENPLQRGEGEPPKC